jgi:hypothetical protein
MVPGLNPAPTKWRTSHMTALEHIRTSNVAARTILVVIGCLPTLLYVYVINSILVAWVLCTGVYLGFWIVAASFLLWLIGTAGLAVLVYSSATFNPSSRRLPIWQRAGLIGGIIAAIPIVFWYGFTGNWWMSMSALMACLAASWILFSSWKGRQRNPDEPCAATSDHVSG